MLLLLTPLAAALQLSVAPSHPMTAVDSARQTRFNETLKQTNDSLNRVRGALAGFQRDLETASGALVLERARHVVAGCRAGRAGVALLDSLLAVETYSPHSSNAQSRLRQGNSKLRATLGRCLEEWAVPDPTPPTRSDSLRAWGPYRAAGILTALRQYAVTVSVFAEAAGFVK